MMKIYKDSIPENHFTVDYYVESKKTLVEVAEAIAIGQSIGNPSVRNEFETDELVENHCAKIIGDYDDLKSKNKGTIKIAFPTININWEEDGISQFICDIMGGQTDIDIIEKCHVIDVDIFDYYEILKPKFGISGIRKITGQYEKPILGCILKPKIGLRPKEIAHIVKEMIDGGADLIKEDEIMCNPVFANYEDRLGYIRDIIKDKPIVYLATCNGDAHKILEKAKKIHDNGSNGLHVNLWSGFGTYRSVRKLDLPMVIHYQKSGDKVITHKNNPYMISWYVLCKIATWCGIDTIHSGMWGGYLSDDPIELKTIMDYLSNNNVLPALSCGMNAELIPKVTEKFGYDYLANVGGAVHSNPNGIKAAVIELRRAIEKTIK
jgi:ribulose 1,5-bisphosphate carboxylase large subunit-like protein